LEFKLGIFSVGLFAGPENGFVVVVLGFFRAGGTKGFESDSEFTLLETEGVE